MHVAADQKPRKKLPPAQLSVADDGLLPWTYVSDGHKLNGSSRLAISKCSIGSWGVIGNIKKGNKGEAVFAQLEGSAADARKAPLHVCRWAVIVHWGGKTGQEPCKPVLHKSHYITDT